MARYRAGKKNGASRDDASPERIEAGKKARRARDAARRARANDTEASRRQLAVDRATMFGRSSRSAGSRFLCPIDGTGRTALQIQRDTLSDGMSKDWLPADLNLGANRRKGFRPRPRGILNTGCHCYWNSILQTFMQMPQFLQWIRRHVRNTNSGGCASKTFHHNGELVVSGNTLPCMACNFKGLVEEYWGPTDPRHPIPGTSASLEGIKNAAFHRLKFHPAAQIDASEAMMNLFDLLSSAEPPGPRINEFDTLFRFNKAQFIFCQACGRETESTSGLSTDIGLTVHIHNSGRTRRFNTIDDAIEYELDNPDKDENLSSTCTSATCNGAQTMKTRKWVIRAAPQILVITLSLIGWDRKNGSAFKYMRTLALQEEVNLTRYQEAKGVPLQYRLSGVVSHEGKEVDRGHYVSSVRSQGDNPLYNINDSTVSAINGAQFIANPQRPPSTSEKFQAYILTYIQDEGPLKRFDKSKERKRLI